MNVNDLKIGMIFSNENAICGETIFYKIFNIIGETIFYYFFHPFEFCCNTKLSYLFIEDLKLIDKVYSKIVVIEEEVSVYINPCHLEELLRSGANPYGSQLFLTKQFEFQVELCKIKRKVKKELEFNWEKGIYE